MSQRYSTAIVLGASISGLLTARVLSQYFEQIIVVEKDRLPVGEGIRNGVAQAAHAHGLLASGYRIMDQYFPGMMDELHALGAPRCDTVEDFLWFQHGHWKLRHKSGYYGICVSRLCLEAAIRRRVKALPNVTFLEGTEGVKPLFESTCNRITGFIVRGADDSVQNIDAQLVVDASGRRSKSPKWLTELGFEPPKKISLQVDVGYATRVFERKPGDFFDSFGGIISGTPPKGRRMAAVLAAEGNRWIVTMVGTAGDHPPANERDWIEFAASLPVPEVHDLVTSNQPLSEIVSYHIPNTQRRFYERMKSLPMGYVAIGDAICNFNPVYGQGMSVAAAEAKALEESLAGGLARLPNRFYQRASKIINNPWTIATGEDFRFPQIKGQRPLGYRMTNKYMERVHAVASIDPAVCKSFFDVLNLFSSPASLVSPGNLWRVCMSPLPKEESSPSRPAVARVEQQQAG